MRLLLDTHIVLWLLTADSRLPAQATVEVAAASKVFVSAASFWELAIKTGLGRLDLDLHELADGVVDSGMEILPVGIEHAIAVRRLPRIHRDPFERMLIAQARHGRLRLLTADKALAAFGENVTVV
ncbi:type II toxin-antitoxin system VapC family toxin [Salinarimonas sp.]|uniref:type II toxin-antitoxin system VapC family toxin n=1 Tax=Salinarimonas sp. TaxID=2766526 RepID=UPI0032D98C84